MRKLHTHLRAAKEAAVERTLPQVREIVMAPHARTVDEELDEAAEVRLHIPKEQQAERACLTYHITNCNKPLSCFQRAVLAADVAICHSGAEMSVCMSCSGNQTLS